MEELLSVQQLSVSFEEDNFAVRDISFSLQDGEFVVLLGSSGAGKSTLLRSLDETYYAGLSDAWKRSFAVQGGELSRSEAMRLLALEGMDDAMALRRWDDRAKVHGVDVPVLDAYRQVVLNHLL